MYKNQLQELAQRSCFNLPSYACIREGPDHAPRFKAVVNFNGESFESPNFCTTLRQAEHAAAEIALDSLSKKGPSKSLAARVLDETGVYKNLLQETAHRAGLSLPVYTTMRSGPGHTPVFTCIVELAGMTFTGEPAKTKKQAQKNAAMAGWCALKKLPHLGSSSSSSKLDSEKHEEQEQVIIARALASIRSSGKSNIGPPNEPLCGRSKTIQADRIRTRNTQLYPKPRYNNWVYSNVIPEAATYQTWHQEHPVHQQGQIFRLSPSQTFNAPQNFPFIQPFQPTQGPYVSVQDPLNSLPWYAEHVPCPPRYFTGYPLPVQRGSSQVSIQEIPDKKNIQEREVLGNDDSDSTGECSKKNHNVTSSATNNTQVEGSDNHLSADSSIVLGVQKEKDKEVNEKSSSNEIATDPELNLSNVGNPNTPIVRISKSKNDQAVRQGGGSNLQGFKWAQGGQNRNNLPSIDHVDHTPISPVPYRSFPLPPTTTKSKTPAPHSQPVPRFDVYRPRSHLTAAPVTIRTAIPVCSSRPVATKSNASVPVFRAGTPAARGSMVSADHTTVTRNPQLESTSKADSEFSELHI